MNHQKTKHKQQQRRRNHVRSRVIGTAERPRLTVFRSSKHIYAQLIDDHAGVTLASASSLVPGVKSGLPYGGNINAAKVVGKHQRWISSSGKIKSPLGLALSKALDAVSSSDATAR